jgi:hypothetical protein
LSNGADRLVTSSGDKFLTEIRNDWMMTITRWRPSTVSTNSGQAKLGTGEGTTETFDFDMANTLPGGRASLPRHLAEGESAKTGFEERGDEARAHSKGQV